jgi:hypothetical protein
LFRYTFFYQRQVKDAWVLNQCSLFFLREYHISQVPLGDKNGDLANTEIVLGLFEPKMCNYSFVAAEGDIKELS